MNFSPHSLEVVLAILDDVLSFARQRGRLQSSFALQPASGSGRQELPELLPSRRQNA